MRYVVVENTPGYLPEDDEPATFGTLTEAQKYAEHLACTIWSESLTADDPENDPGVVQESPTLWRVSTSDPHDLGRVVEVIEDEKGDA